VRELTAARLLATPAEGAPRPRHALLAEAVTAELLPGERVSLHERVAGALEAAGDETLAAEAAGHWAAAGRGDEELRARLAAADAAEQVFAYANAATHWQRAIELCPAEPDADLGDGIDVPHVYIRAVDALEAAGDRLRAGVVAEEAYRRFAHHPDPATAAVIHSRLASLRVLDSFVAALPLMQEALRLFEGAPPSAEHAWAWYRYATHMGHMGGPPRRCRLRSSAGSSWRRLRAPRPRQRGSSMGSHMSRSFVGRSRRGSGYSLEPGTRRRLRGTPKRSFTSPWVKAVTY
jgi:tetratricopeptide (TPR) repeat protein